MMQAMQITLNGEKVVLDSTCSVQQLLEQRGLGKSPCAVEVNRSVVPRRLHHQHQLAEGDSVEIVTLVGGG